MIHFLALGFPLSAFLGSCLGAWGSFLCPLFVAILIPVFDRILAQRESSPPGTWLATLALWSYPLAYVALLAWSLARVAQGLQGFELAGLLASVGICGGVGITAAHELVHRKARAERALGLALLAGVSYAHYRVEHVFGHHRKVATPEDPASGRFGENVYAFWLRCLPASYLSAWRIERKRAGWSARNRMIHYSLVQAVALIGIQQLAGWRGVVFFLAQGLIAVLLLETINYIEHYGLSRSRRADGEYEPYAAHHSWDSGHSLTNWLLFNVGRHSHHHQSPFTEYPGLRVLPTAPRLPAGYATMILVALIPPAWTRIIHPRLGR